MSYSMLVVSQRPLFLRSDPTYATLKHKPWGGHRLAALRGLEHDPKSPYGESWEFSTLAHQESLYQGQPLRQYLGHPLPFLAKLIDTANFLSIQVHPGDTQDVPGKEEAWLILDAAPDAFVYAGLKSGVNKAMLEDATTLALADPRQQMQLLDLLEKIPVEAGSIVLLAARTVHAIGQGILLAEIQQARDCTLRLFDYGRNRPLQTQEALRIIDPTARPILWTPRETTTVLTGKHIHLEIARPGTLRYPAHSSERLLVPLLGTSTIMALDPVTPQTHDKLSPGELVLSTGSAFQVEVSEHAVLVVGSVT